jgi:hypothetical protein
MKFRGMVYDFAVLRRLLIILLCYRRLAGSTSEAKESNLLIKCNEKGSTRVSQSKSIGQWARKSFHPSTPSTAHQEIRTF